MLSTASARPRRRPDAPAIIPSARAYFPVAWERSRPRRADDPPAVAVTRFPRETSARCPAAGTNHNRGRQPVGQSRQTGRPYFPSRKCGAHSAGQVAAIRIPPMERNGHTTSTSTEYGVPSASSPVLCRLRCTTSRSNPHASSGTKHGTGAVPGHHRRLNGPRCSIRLTDSNRVPA